MILLNQVNKYYNKMVIKLLRICIYLENQYRIYYKKV